MKCKHVFSTLVILMILSACQKELSVDNNSNTRTQSDSIYLKAFVSLDTSLPSGQDTLSSVFITYDDKKRPVKLISRFYGPSVLEQTINRFYAGNDTLPLKDVTRSVYMSLVNIDTSFFFYSEGELIKDSAVIYSGTSGTIWSIDSRNFIISGNTVQLIGRRYSSPDPSSMYYSESTQYTRVVQNGNIVLQVTPSAATYDFLVTDQRTAAVYDNRPNPLFRILIRQPLIDNPYLQRNTTLQYSTSTLSGAGLVTTNYNYRYRSDGYPLSAGYFQNGKTVKDVFVYTN